MSSKPRLLDLVSTYAQIKDSSDVAAIEVDDKLWDEIDVRTELHEGRLVMIVPMTEDWPTWEKHPAGDEIVYMLSGAMELVLKFPSGDRTVSLTAMKGVVVPRGIWHTAKVLESGKTLFITPGAGTQNRPLDAALD